MKKFLLSLFIIGAFSAFVFYTGWTQVKVKPGNIGIVVSKTDGIDDKPVENGLFSWHKVFLLPTNAEIKSFSIEPFTAEKRISGSLPSANYYTKSSDFEYDFTFEISLTLSPRSLVELYKLNKISCDEDLQEYLGGVSDSVAQFAADYFLRKAENNPSFRPESVRRDDLVRNIDFYEDFPEVDVSVLALKSCKLPDYQLYRHLKEKALTSTVQSNIFDSDTNTDIDTSESEDIL